jgi:hypothetical protein
MDVRYFVKVQDIQFGQILRRDGTKLYPAMQR